MLTRGLPGLNRRFDICEAYSCLAHDFGLYALNTRLDRLGFKPRPTQTVDTLGEDARAIYDALSDAALKAEAYDAGVAAGIKAGVMGRLAQQSKEGR